MSSWVVYRRQLITFFTLMFLFPPFSLFKSNESIFLAEDILYMCVEGNKEGKE